MGEVERTPTGWCTDEVLTGQIVSALESSEGRDFIYTITVQAHGKYTDVEDWEEDDSSASGEEDVEWDETQSWEYYAEQLADTDRFVGELVETLSDIDEPTVVVFFGDHQPSLEIDETLLDNGDQFTTEYLIWSNFGLEKQDVDLQAYQLGAYVQQRLGLCLGVISALHCEYEFDSENEQYQYALQTIEYDMLYGEKYIFGGKDRYLPTGRLRNNLPDQRKVFPFTGTPSLFFWKIEPILCFFHKHTVKIRTNI